MKWNVKLKVKSYIREWSDQNVKTSYSNVDIIILIKDTICDIELNGKNVEEVFYLIWELLFLYDGYFYRPIQFWVDGNEQDASKLIRVNFYNTGKQWYSSELLGRNRRDLSEDVKKKYDKFRNTGRCQKKMTKSMVNAFYYIHSEAYEKINSNHLLSLILNIGDGFIINTFKETRNVRASLDRLFKGTIDVEKVRKGISLLGMSAEQFKYNLAEERNEFDHYVFSENSIATFVYESNDGRSKYITWFFIYVLELVIRINFLQEIEIEIDQIVKDYALDVIIDWIIYENRMDIECTTSMYQIRQKIRKINEKIEEKEQMEKRNFYKEG